ncbi:MAG TPA: Flp pilus assembly complex ATPase component TadA [Firmicutes bacterium]|jgi:twitching motility protein PilT|nr:Flp pilus assembly complex ATPase component TadA [Candidatus Fermentithermobacillaceae bacterium]
MSHAGPGRPYLACVAQACFQCGASYVYILPGNKPLSRTGLDEPVPFEGSVVESSHIDEFIASQVPLLQKQIFDSTGFARFASGLFRGARCRVDLITTVSGPAIVMHFLPDSLPGTDVLNISREVLEFAGESSGIFLLCGKPGSGKTTTLASILQYINETTFKHIVWICDAGEYVLTPCKAFVNQIETGYLGHGCDLIERAAWLGADVIALDLQLDENLAWQAVRTAEMGASVFLALNASNTASGLENLANTVSSGSRREFIHRLSHVFSGALYQELIQGVESPVPAMEILVGTDPVRNLLREGRFLQITDLIAAGGKYRMQTLEADKKRLSGEGLI